MTLGISVLLCVCNLEKMKKNNTMSEKIWDEAVKMADRIRKRLPLVQAIRDSPEEALDLIISQQRLINKLKDKINTLEEKSKK